MKAISCTVLAAAVFAAMPAHAAEFLVQIGSPVGGASCGGADTGISTSPVSRDVTCSTGTPGLLDARAAALFGHVGGSSGASVGGGYFGSSFGINTTSQFSDFVTFTSTDPNVTSALIAANLAFSGTMNATSFAFTNVGLFYHLDGGSSFHFFAASQDGVNNPHFNIVQGSVSSTVSNALLQTAMFSVPMNVPMRMTLRLDTGAGVGGSGSPESARTEFSNSFEVPLGMDAFVLPAGVTANAGDWLVNNRRVGGLGAIPEPSTWAMLILGFGVVGASLRRRKMMAAA